MKKRNLFLGVVCGLIVIGLCGFWLVSKVGEGFREFPVEKTKEALIAGLADRVLAPDLVSDANRSSGLIERSQRNPALVHKEYILVTTWLHASHLFLALRSQPFRETVLSSATLTNVASEDRMDGWGNPYCILADAKRITFLSSGGTGVLDCEKSVQLAKQAALQAKDSRLSVHSNILAAVYERAASPPEIGVQDIKAQTM